MPQDKPVKPRKIRLILPNHLQIEIDGKIVQGNFKVKSEWNGLIQLECDSPMQRAIIHKPSIPMHEEKKYLHQLFGGTMDARGIEVEIVTSDIHGLDKP